MYFFQSMFHTVYLGITGSSAMTTVQSIGTSILLLCTLFGVYECWVHGGDHRALAMVGLRYLFFGLVITQYPNVFLHFNDAANNIAQTISPNDVWTNFKSQTQGFLGSPAGETIWHNLISGQIPGLLSIATQTVALEIFPITYALFAFFYAFYGAILYITGPLVLALYPARGTLPMARTYLTNLLIWNTWGILYAIFSLMLSILNAGSLTDVFSANSFGGFFQGASQALLLSLSSILLSILIAFIPALAKRIISGDVGSAFFTVLGAASTALQTAMVANEGMRAGSAGGGDDRGIGPGGDDMHKNNQDGSNRPPRPPDESSHRPHVSGLQYIPYGVGWMVGRTARTISTAVRKD